MEKREGDVKQATLQTTALAKELECLSIQAHPGVPFTFMEEDMLIGDVKYNCPLYFTRYIRVVEVPRIQIDLGSTVNIMLARLMTAIGIP